MTPVLLTTTERLTRTLSDPVTKSQAAAVLGVGLASVYESLREFDAARIHGDLDLMGRHIPCIHQGGIEQRDGTFRGGRYIIPRDAFVRWYTSAGLDGSLLDELYGAPS